jgi:hypothetical protein
MFEHPWTDSLVSLSSDEDDRDLLLPSPQFSLKVMAGHPRHSDVEKQTFSLVDAIGREELFSRRKCPNCKAELPE